MTPEFENKVQRTWPRVLLVAVFLGMAFAAWKIVYGGGIHIPPSSEWFSVEEGPVVEPCNPETHVPVFSDCVPKAKAPSPDCELEPGLEECSLQEIVPPEDARTIPLRVGQWATINTNNVLVWEMDGDQCAKRSAHSQWHEGEVVLILSEQDRYSEVESDDQEKPFTRGCVRSDLLELME